jgi:hypothetical protein
VLNFEGGSLITSVHFIIKIDIFKLFKNSIHIELRSR